MDTRPGFSQAPSLSRCHFDVEHSTFQLEPMTTSTTKSGCTMNSAPHSPGALVQHEQARRRRALAAQARWWEYATTIWNTSEIFVTIRVRSRRALARVIAFGLTPVSRFLAAVVCGTSAATPKPPTLIEHERHAAHRPPLSVYWPVPDRRRHQTASRHTTSRRIPFGRLVAATVVVMFVLAWGKRRTRALANRPLVANASMTFIDAASPGNPHRPRTERRIWLVVG